MAIHPSGCQAGPQEGPITKPALTEALPNVLNHWFGKANYTFFWKTPQYFNYSPLQFTISRKNNQLEDGTFSSGSEIVDNDSVLKTLDKKINELWCTLFSKDKTSDSGFRFDEVKEKELAPQLLEMINKLINRLNEINDGSYKVEDMITDHLKSLI